MILLQILKQKKTSFLIILSFTASGLLLRVFLTDFGKIEYDGLLYYEYASTIAFQGRYPDTAIQLHNIGWVLFLVPFFKIIGVHQETLIFSQQILSIILSSVTIPLSYLFAKRFIKNQYAMFVPLFFAVDFRMAQNAGFGITEPLVMVLSLAAYSSKNRLLMFGMVGLACMVRFEAIMLIPVLFAIHKDRKMLPYVLIPVMVLTVLFLVNNSLGHPDQFVSKINHEMNFIESPATNIIPNFDYWIKGISNSVVYMVWAAFPTFVLSVYGMSKKRWLVVPLFILSISGLYAYLDAYDTRYFFPMFPFLALACAFAFQYIMNMKNIKHNEDNK